MSTLFGIFGALGGWKKIDEQFDDAVVKQSNDASCVSAVGQMLAQYHGLIVTQEEIMENIGDWSNSIALASYLNSKETRNEVEWIGGGFSASKKFIAGITESTKVWAVMLRQSETAGHAVLITGQDENGLIEIKDPFDQTSYKMEIDDLYEVLNELVLPRKRKQ